MAATTQVFDRRALIILRGEVDAYNAVQIRDELNRLLGQGIADITVDVGELDFLDSSAIGAITRGTRHARQAGGDLQLVSRGPWMNRILEITGLRHLLTIVN